MDLDECQRREFIKLSFPNKSKALSLIEVSDIKEETVNGAKIDEKSVNAYLPLAYDSLRETLEAFCLLKGYNVTNHICLGELLKNLMPEFDFVSFDRFRYARNGINYYGKKVDLQQGKDMINNIFIMKNKVKREVLRIVKEGKV